MSYVVDVLDPKGVIEMELVNWEESEKWSRRQWSEKQDKILTGEGEWEQLCREEDDTAQGKGRAFWCVGGTNLEVWSTWLKRLPDLGKTVS